MIRWETESFKQNPNPLVVYHIHGQKIFNLKQPSRPGKDSKRRRRRRSIRTDGVSKNEVLGLGPEGVVNFPDGPADIITHVVYGGRRGRCEQGRGHEQSRKNLGRIHDWTRENTERSGERLENVGDYIYGSAGYNVLETKIFSKIVFGKWFSASHICPTFSQ